MKIDFKDKKIIIPAVAVVLVVIGILWWQYAKWPGVLDAFAQCISSKNAKFYGAFWCPHCQDQKKSFGSSAKYLPYIECSTANGQGQIDVCSQAKVKGYPTWEFADGSRLEGELTLQKLSEKTACPLPES